MPIEVKLTFDGLPDGQLSNIQPGKSNTYGDNGTDFIAVHCNLDDLGGTVFRAQLDDSKRSAAEVYFAVANYNNLEAEIALDQTYKCDLQMVRGLATLVFSHF